MAQVGRLLIRARGWNLSVGSAAKAVSVTECRSATIDRIWPSATLPDSRQHPALEQCNLSYVRQYSDQSPALSSASSSQPDAGNTVQPSAGRLAFPKWLRNLFPGGKHLASPGAPAPSSTADAATDSSKKGSSDDEDIKQLEEIRNMTMEGYVDYCKKMRSGSTPPRPRAPPVPRGHYDYFAFVDTRRIAYLRLLQHERIGSLITREEGDMILAKRDEVLRDRSLLEDIANRTGVYIDLEVKDCIQQYLELRKRGDRFHRFVVDFKKPLPRTESEQRNALKFMELLDADTERKATLARRDPQACPLREKLPWTGPSAVCGLTGLKYTECCGQLGATRSLPAAVLRPSGEWPPAGNLAKGRKNEPTVDDMTRKKAIVKFKGSSERRLRKMYMRSMTPRFRNY